MIKSRLYLRKSKKPRALQKLTEPRLDVSLEEWPAGTQHSLPKTTQRLTYLEPHAALEWM